MVSNTNFPSYRQMSVAIGVALVGMGCLAMVTPLHQWIPQGKMGGLALTGLGGCLGASSWVYRAISSVRDQEGEKPSSQQKQVTQKQSSQSTVTSQPRDTQKTDINPLPQLTLTEKKSTTNVFEDESGFGDGGDL